MKKLNNKKGFTIVELVIVIAVIGILAGVLIPTFSGIVGKANGSGALQQARSTLTNALNMSSTAQLAGKNDAGNYQTVFVLNSSKNSDIVPDYMWGYNGNALEAVAIKYDSAENPTAFATAEQLKIASGNSGIFNTVLLGASAIEPKESTESAAAHDELNAVTKSIIEKSTGKTVSKIEAGSDKYTITFGDGTTISAYTSVDIASNIVVFTRFAA